MKSRVVKFRVMLKKTRKWLDVNVGWFFVNGRKQEDWNRYLKEKYKDK